MSIIHSSSTPYSSHTYIQRLLTTEEEDPTLPYSHVSDPDVEHQFIVSYSSAEALAAIEDHISEQPDSIKIKGHKQFSRPQKKKKKRGDRRKLQEEDSVGYAVIVTGKSVLVLFYHLHADCPCIYHMY